jgi:septal ring-binding cell division protein DamX
MQNNFTIFDINTIMRFGIIVILLLAINIALAQADNKKGKANMLSKQEASKIFTEDVKSKLKITFPVVRAYSYNDTSGKYYIDALRKI